MSHSTEARTINQQKHPKIYFKQYIHDTNEPRDVSSRDMPIKLEIELVENSYIMRRELRQKARRLRDQYS
jgi:hypothetical protein